MIYTCYAEHIGYSFPKQKWWEKITRRLPWMRTGKPRETIMEFTKNFSGREIRIVIRILERPVQTGFLETEQDFRVFIPEHLYVDICQEFILQSCKGKRFEILLLLDPQGKIGQELVHRAAEDRNYLAVYTKNPQAYEGILERIEQENGLVGMLFTNYREWKQYQRGICENRKSLVFLGNTKTGKGGDAEPVFFRASKESLVLDLRDAVETDGVWKVKSMGNDYASLCCYLDNIVKNGYNSLVNKGLHLQPDRYRENEKTN